MQKSERLNCQACPLGKVMGQKGCPGTKLKMKGAGLVKKTCASKINGNGITVRLKLFKEVKLCPDAPDRILCTGSRKTSSR